MNNNKLPNLNRKRIKGLEVTLYLLPSLVVFAVFMVWPILHNLYLSVLEWNMVSPTKKYVGLNNYVTIVTDADFVKALGNTTYYVLYMLFFCFVMPYILSYIIGKLISRGAHFYRAIMFFPSLLSLAVAAIVFMWIFNSVAGPVAEIYDFFGKTSPSWFKSSGYVIFILSLITAWRSFGYNLIVFLSAMVEVPIEIIEAAKLEKASNWQIFWKIMVPMTSSTALYVFIISFVFGLQHVFTPINMLTQGGPNQASTNLVYIIYQYGFKFFQTGRAAAVAIVSLIVFLAVVVLQKQLEKRVHYEN